MNNNFITQGIELYTKEHGKTVNPTTDFSIILDQNGLRIEDWNIAELAQPTLSELTPYVNAAEAAHNATTYQRNRQQAYPITGDQLDAIWKGFAALETAGATLPEDTATMLANIQAVKTMHPKPA